MPNTLQAILYGYGDTARINHRIAGGAGEGVHPTREQATFFQALQGGTG